MIFSSSDILSPAQMRRLGDHRYSSTGTTLLDPIVQPFWNWLVMKLPLWFSPNAMTVIGLSINILTSIILICYSTDAIAQPPRWSYLVCALGLFFYQTLDALDGKQARRTGSSSPLGELLDHGCDSLSTIFVGVGVCITLQLGTYRGILFLQCFVAIVLFYCAHWQTYVSGTLRFGKFDVTEVQAAIIFIYLLSAIFGPSIWNIQIPSIYLDLKLIPIIIAMIAASVAFYSNFTVILTGGVGKNGSTVAGTSVLSPFIPIGLVVLSAFIIYQKLSYNTYHKYPCLYILAYGIVASKITNKLVMAHMAKSEIEYLDSIFIGPGMLFMNQYFDRYIDDYIVLWMCIVYSCADYLHYSIIVCNQICRYLNIYFFTITPKLASSEPDNIDSKPMLSTSSNGRQRFRFRKKWEEATE